MLIVTVPFCSLEDRVEYLSGAKMNPHYFCGNCGSVLATDLTVLMRDMLKLPPRFAVNLRMLRDFDRKKLKLRSLKGMKEFGQKYEVQW